MAVVSPGQNDMFLGIGGRSPSTTFTRGLYRESSAGSQIEKRISKCYVVDSSCSFLRLGTRFWAVFGTYCSQLVLRFSDAHA